MAIVNGYATVDQLSDHLKDDRIPADDPKVERIIEASSRVIDTWTKRRFYLDDEATVRTYEGTSGYASYGYNFRIPVHDFVALVAVTPETSLGVLGTPYDSTVYRPGPLNAALDGEPYNWIEGTSTWWGHFAVEAIWGWPSVPSAVTEACLLIAARFLKRRESVNATVGFDEFAMRLSSTDPDVAAMLSPYRWLTVG